MAYTPKWTSLTQVRAFEGALANVSDSDVLEAIQEAELIVERFLLSHRFDPNNLETGIEKLAGYYSAWLTIKALIGRLPIAPEGRLQVYAVASKMSDLVKKAILDSAGRRFPFGVRGKFEEIKG